MNLTFSIWELSAYRLGNLRAPAEIRGVALPSLRRALPVVGTLLLLLLLLLLPAQASADVFTLRFTGMVTILPVNPVPGFEGAATGDLVNGSIVFDTSVPDLLPDEPQGGEYEGAIRRFAISVGNDALSVTGPTGSSAVNDGVSFPPFDLVGFGVANPSQTIQLLAQFLSPDGVIQGDRIPTSADVLMRFATRRFRILHVPDFDVSPRGLAGTIDSVTIEPSAVPEPATLLLAATGAGMIARRRWAGRLSSTGSRSGSA